MGVQQKIQSSTSFQKREDLKRNAAKFRRNIGFKELLRNPL